MHIRRSALALGVRAGLFVFLALPALHGQADSSLFYRGVAAASPARPAGVAAAVQALYRKHCAKCHGDDGKGSKGRDLFSEIPDFTKAAWHRKRGDAQLLVSILDGKGTGMPSLAGKITKSEARDLLRYVRAFAPASKKAGHEQKEASSVDSFDDRYRALQKELAELQEQFRKLSESSVESEDNTPSLPAGPAESSRDVAPFGPDTLVMAEVRIEGDLYGRYCTRCHDVDGSGSRARHRQPEIPNFTDPDWQSRRSDAQLLASILEGTGESMPPWHGKISTEQARGLVAQVRTFATTAKNQGEEKPKASGSAPPTAKRPDDANPPEAAESRPSAGFLYKLIAWLGNFHPATVHFPIAMLAAAAVSELLRLVTHHPAFDAITRYCLWFGTLTAVAAGVLGWFLGEFHLVDASWLLTAHRWLGTSTLVSAVLLLGMSEWRRRTAPGATRIWFRAALLIVTGLVLATGFFGGAVVYGLDHYSWPK